MHTSTHTYTMPKQSNMRQKVSKNDFEIISCWPSTVWNGARPKIWLVYPVRLPWRNCFFLFEQLSIEDNVLVKKGDLSLLPHLST